MKEYLSKKAIQIPIYSSKLIVVFTNSSRKVRQYVPTFDKNDTGVFAHAYWSEHKGFNAYYLILNFNGKTKMDHGVIAHEAFHVTNYIAEHAGFIPTHENDEPQAYLLSWVTNEVYKFMKTKGFKIQQ